MNKPLIELLEAYPEYVRLREALVKGEGPVSVYGLGDGHRLHMSAALTQQLGKTVLIAVANETLSLRLFEQLSGYGVEASHYPYREMPFSARHFVASRESSEKRIAALSGLCEGKRMVVVASAAALMQRVAPPEVMIDALIHCKVGECVPPQTLLRRLIDAGYERVDVCEGRGQVTLRGGYMDIFPTTSDNPVRIEFFDDEIDTMRAFDALTQRSIENLTDVLIPPASETPLSEKARQRALAFFEGKEGYDEEVSALCAQGAPANTAMLLPAFYGNHAAVLTDYLPSGALILIDEPVRMEESARIAHAEFLDALSMGLEDGTALPEQEKLMLVPNMLFETLNTRYTAMNFLLTRSFSPISPKALFHFETRAATRYLGNEELLKEDILYWKKNSVTVLLYAGSRAKRLQDRLLDMDILLPVVDTLSRAAKKGEQIILNESIPWGFEYPECKFVAISEAELYGVQPQRRATPRKKGHKLVFSELSIGDLIVHELYGIGRFMGVETLIVGSEKSARDYLLLVYAGGDKLYIPTDQLDRIQKYIGSDEEQQKLSKLGSGEWQKTLSRTREGVKKLAMDLVKLYGERSRLKGFRFSADTPWQQRLEQSFPYQETPDQITSIQEIKRDMESDKVMDRLLCGDVGYGKTEVALRACFKAAMDSKQAAILVPTTILAQQHYNTLTARFSGFPLETALLSRFNTPKQEREILQKLEDGSIDVIVGTHKLLSKNVKFHDLGLLVVDEEQRFGVGHKEQIKALKQNVDVLTLSATPIPRTLHMSMTGIRDMSVIDTPPEQRYPVQTYVMEYSDVVVREAILKELGRGGQVYLLYNNVRGMERYANNIRTLVPEAGVTFAHGQMSERQLERTMLEFMDGQYDVLICSTIIENGLDIQNVNTMIIYDADHMGLSQLYQLRGRVGRGSRLGYAYLTYRRNKVLSNVAEKRLSAIREFTQFGSGFKIAMQDLEIRGAGNLLGAEQHGFMASVGYELYAKLVDSAVREAKGELLPKRVDTVVDAPLSANISRSYIARQEDRLSMYKRIALIDSRDDLLDVQDEMIDRFGEIPEQTQNLLHIALIKSAAQRAYITKVQIREGEARLTYDSEALVDGAKLLELVQKSGDTQLIAGETPVLVIRRKGEEGSVDTLSKTLPLFIHLLEECVVQETATHENI